MDADIKAEYPLLCGWSSFTFLLPMMAALPFLAYFDPVEDVRHLIVGLLCIPTILLFGIWAWRVVLEGSRQYKNAQKSKVRRAKKNG
jgi:hypothetical protein